MNGAPSIHQRADGLSLGAFLFALLCGLFAYMTTQVVRSALDSLNVYSVVWEFIFGLAILAVFTLVWPAWRSLQLAKSARACLAKGDVVQARIDTAASREFALRTFGWGVFAIMMLGFQVVLHWPKY